MEELKQRRVSILTILCVCVIEICEGVLHWCRSYLDPFYLSLCRLGRVLVFFVFFFSDLLGRKEGLYAKKEEQVVALESVL